MWQKILVAQLPTTIEYKLSKITGMETLNEFATLIGFGTFKGMMMYFGFLTLILLIGFGIYYGQKSTDE